MLALCTSLVCTSRAADIEVVGHPSPPRPAGITFEELAKLGRRTDSDLIKRFSDPNNEKYREGLLQRLVYFGNLKKPNPQIEKGLKEFIEHEVSTCKGEVDLRRIFTIGSALERLGQRGGEAGANYLKSWVKDQSVYGRINCSSYKRDVADTQEALRRNALMGIGWNGTESSMEFLSWIGSHPPVVKYSGSFMGVLNTAVSVNSSIRKNGIEQYLKDGRDSMLSYGKMSEYNK